MWLTHLACLLNQDVLFPRISNINGYLKHILWIFELECPMFVTFQIMFFKMCVFFLIWNKILFFFFFSNHQQSFREGYLWRLHGPLSCASSCHTTILKSTFHNLIKLHFKEHLDFAFDAPFGDPDPNLIIPILGTRIRLSVLNILIAGFILNLFLCQFYLSSWFLFFAIEGSAAVFLKSNLWSFYPSPLR